MHGLVAVRGERPQRGGDVRGLRVVDVAHAVALADELQPVRHARERTQRLGDRRVGDAGRTRSRSRRGGVLAVVRPSNQRLRRQGIVGGELDPVEAEPARDDLRSRPFEDAQLRVPVGVERAVAVEVVGLQVEQNGDVAGEARARPRAETRTARRRPSPPRAPSVSGVPTFPATATSRPAARKIAPSSSVVVVLPFVPVTPTNFEPGSSRNPSSTSDHTGMPRSRAATHERCASRNARRLHDHVDAVEERQVVLVPERRGRRRPDRRAARSRRGPSARGRRRALSTMCPEGQVVLVEEREAGGAEDRRDDPEAHHDLRLRPRLHLEVML